MLLLVCVLEKNVILCHVRDRNDSWWQESQTYRSKVRRIDMHSSALHLDYDHNSVVSVLYDMHEYFFHFLLVFAIFCFFHCRDNSSLPLFGETHLKSNPIFLGFLFVNFLLFLQIIHSLFLMLLKLSIHLHIITTHTLRHVNWVWNNMNCHL